jgi:hypothetical protein
MLTVYLCSIQYWGRVTGTVADYILACGTVSSMEVPVRKYYYMCVPPVTLSNARIRMHAVYESGCDLHGNIDSHSPIA